MLVCPETHQPLHEAEPALLDQLNALIRAEELRNRSGDLITESLPEGLIREDRQLLFPVVDGIPKMIVDEAIALNEVT